MEIILGLIIGLLAGAGGMFFVRNRLTETKLGEAEQQARRKLEEARDEARRQAEEIREEAKRDALKMVREFEQHAREEAERRARKIVITAIQRLGTEQAQEASVSVLQLPSEDMKGRIIGREGRNIRSFEQTTGVNLIIDDTPEAVLLSCFDPVRRETARLTLEELIADGRIHPTRIEEVYERSHADVDGQCARAGKDAALEVGITDLHPELVAT